MFSQELDASIAADTAAAVDAAAVPAAPAPTWHTRAAASLQIQDMTADELRVVVSTYRHAIPSCVSLCFCGLLSLLLLLCESVTSPAS